MKSKEQPTKPDRGELRSRTTTQLEIPYSCVLVT